MIELRSGALRCELVPDLGGCIAGLWLGELPVLRSTPAAQLQSARQSGCYPLVPFSNRIGQATLVSHSDFDILFLNAELARIKCGPIASPCIDTLAMARG